MKHVTSKDGTSIAYERVGTGPAVILVGGGLDDGTENAPLGPALAEHFTVYNYARRGRAGSGDTLPYAVEREIEDIEALLAEAGGSAHAFGASSGGALALEAAAAGVAFDRVAVYEVPYELDADAPRRHREYVEGLDALLAEGRRGDAVALFMRLAGSSEQDVASARSWQGWPGLEVLAPTLAYDAACLRMGASQPPAHLMKITQRTLVAVGGSGHWEEAAVAIAAVIPRAEREIIEGAGHMVDAKAVAPVLDWFFRA